MRKARIKVYGMDCPSCSSSIEKIVRRHLDVESVKCSYLEGTLYIEYSGHKDFSLLKEKLLRFGYRIPEDTVHIIITKNEKETRDDFLSSFDGALEWIDNKDGSVTLKAIRLGDTEGSIINFFEKKNIEITIIETENGDEEILEETQIEILRNLILSVLFTFPLLWGPPPFVQAILGTLIILFPARCFYRGMIHSIKSRNMNMDVLVSLSTSIIYIFSLYTAFTEKNDIKLYFLCQGVLISMLLFGRYLESTAKNETTRALRKLMSLIPRKAKIIDTEGNTKLKDISEIRKWEKIALEKGERIPLDGIVEVGECTTDEAMMTGESALIKKKKGDTLLSGTIIRDGSVVMEVISKREDSLIERVIEIVRKAESDESPVKKKTDRIASVFIPVVIVISLSVFLLWYFVLSPSNLEKAVITAAGVLVVACPCALGLAIPTSIMVGSGRAAEMGILFKNTAVFSLMGSIDTIAVDKTGTLTTGINKGDEEEIRPGAEEFVSSMKKRGIDLVLISGDKEKKVKTAAESIGIKKIYYQVKSDEKAAIINKLKEEGRNTLMIGDGVNDAPAMAMSTVSISIENGTEIAKDAADIIILNDEIEKIEDVFLLSEKIVRNIKENLIWALLYNAVAIPLAAAGIMNPSVASAAMSFSSIAVLMNSLKLRKMEVKR